MAIQRNYRLSNVGGQNDSPAGQLPYLNIHTGNTYYINILWIWYLPVPLLSPSPYPFI